MAQLGKAARCGLRWASACPSLTSFICRLMAELMMTSAVARPAMAAARNPAWSLIELSSSYCTRTSGCIKRNPAMMGATAGLSMVPRTCSRGVSAKTSTPAAARPPRHSAQHASPAVAARANRLDRRAQEAPIGRTSIGSLAKAIGPIRSRAPLRGNKPFAAGRGPVPGASPLRRPTIAACSLTYRALS